MQIKMCIKIGDYPGGHTTVPNETLRVILDTSKSFSLFPLNDLRVGGEYFCK